MVAPSVFLQSVTRAHELMNYSIAIYTIKMYSVDVKPVIIMLIKWEYP